MGSIFSEEYTIHFNAHIKMLKLYYLIFALLILYIVMYFRYVS